MDSHNHLIDHKYVTKIMINPHISLISGQLTSRKTLCYEESLTRGIKLALVTQGTLGWQIPGKKVSQIEGPMLCVIASSSKCSYEHLFNANEPIKYTIVVLQEEALLPFENELLPLIGKASHNPFLQIFRVPTSLTAIANQINSCPQTGIVRDFYLQAKTLEFTALAAEMLLKDQTRRSAMGWRHVDIEKLHHAKFIIDHNLHQSITLAQLAQEVGLNTRKLSAGFREVFNTTVYNYFQETRLQEAFRLLSSGEYNVSTIAYQVGYTPTHFSVAFRKRFNILPRDLMAK